MKKIYTLMIAVFFLTAVTGFAQVRKSGITGAAFLKIGVGAKQVALGSAVSAVSGDVNQIFWNPAGIATLEKTTQLTFSRNNWIADIGHNSFAVNHHMGSMGNLAFGFVQLGVSGITADRDNSSNLPPFLSVDPFDDKTEETYDYSDMALYFSWGRYFTDKLSLGVTAKYITESIDGERAGSIAWDFGSIYHVGYKDLTIGARLQNLGGDLKFFNEGAPLPLVFSVGARMSVMQNDMHRLTLQTDATKLQDSEQLLYGGVEYGLMENFFVRGGYKFNYSGAEDDRGYKTTEEGMTFGGGLDIPFSTYNIQFDYAYTDFGLMDSVHRFTFGFAFK